MTHGNSKKTHTEQAAPATKTKTTQQTGTSHQKPTPPPKVKSAAREKQIIWQGDNDVDFEDITFVVPIIISVIILFIFFLRKYIRWTVECQSNNRIDGKTVIITGANSGIGRATATELAKRGGRVYLGCRDRAKGEAVALGIRTKTRNPDVYSYELDLASLASIKDFVDEFDHREPCLHILINNAAYMGPKDTTQDGLERTFGVNYLGHFYLTYLLTEKLKKSAPSRVINMVSDSYAKGKLDFEDLAYTNYDMYKAYGRSKLALVVFNLELHRRLSPDIVHSFGVHPGMVCTDLLRNWPGFIGNMLRGCARVFFKSPEDGCQTVVFCAVADKLRDLSGKVLENCSVFKVKSFVKDHDLGEKLWNVSLQLCGVVQEKQETDEELKNAEKPSVVKPKPETVGPEETKKAK